MKDIESILIAHRAGQVKTEDALASVMAYLQPSDAPTYEFPTAVVTNHPTKGISVVLHNWMGIGSSRMEQMYHHMVVATQQFRAKMIQQDRIKESKDVAA